MLQILVLRHEKNSSLAVATQLATGCGFIDAVFAIRKQLSHFFCSLLSNMSEQWFPLLLNASHSADRTTGGWRRFLRYGRSTESAPCPIVMEDEGNASIP